MLGFVRCVIIAHLAALRFIAVVRKGISPPPFQLISPTFPPSTFFVRIKKKEGKKNRPKQESVPQTTTNSSKGKLPVALPKPTTAPLAKAGATSAPGLLTAAVTAAKIKPQASGSISMTSGTRYGWISFVR